METLRLTIDGHPNAAIRIHINDEATPSELHSLRRSADRLQRLIAKTTGAKLDITDEALTAEGNEIVLLVEELSGPALPGSQRNLSERYQIRFEPGKVILAGASHTAVEYATDAFLTEYCGVRFFGPTELGEDVIPVKKLEVATVPVDRKPFFSHRQQWRHIPAPDSLGFQLLGSPSPEQSGEFNRRLRRAAPDGFGANHSLYKWYRIYWEKDDKYPEEFVERRPGLFAKMPDGSPLYYAGRPGQLDYANPEVIQMLVDEARAHFDEGNDFFAITPMDNDSFCLGPDSVAAGSQDTRDRGGYGWPTNASFVNGKNSNYWFGFINKVASEVAKTHPGKFISTLAYASFSLPPDFPLEENVAVMICLMTRSHDTVTWQNQYQAWLDKEQERIPLWVWLYYYYPESGAASQTHNHFPGFFDRAAAGHFARFAADGIQGAFLNGGSFEQLDLLGSFAMMNDPSMDYVAFREDFFARYYGPSAEFMRDIYDEIEDVFMDPENYPPVDKFLCQTEEIAWGSLGTPERMARWGTLMEQATEAAVDSPYQERVVLFRDSVWKHMQEGARTFANRHEQSGLLDVLRSEPPISLALPMIPRGPEVDWTAIPKHSLFANRDYAKASIPLNVAIAVDETHLYFRLESAERRSDLTQHPELWRGDSWEIFLASERATPYLQFVIGPAGGIVQIEMQEAGGTPPIRPSFSPNYDESDPEKWVTLIEIPLDFLRANQIDPKHFFFNVMHTSSSSALSPTLDPSHHVVERFAEVIAEQ